MEGSILYNIIASLLFLAAGVAPMLFPRKQVAACVFWGAIISAAILAIYGNWDLIMNPKPQRLITLGLLGVWFFATLAIGGMVWQYFSPPAPMTIDGLDSLGGVPSAPAQAPLAHKKNGLTERHQNEVLSAIETYRGWLNGPILDSYQAGDKLFVEGAGGLKEMKSALEVYGKRLSALGADAEQLGRNLEVTPEVVSLGPWYYGDLQGAVQNLIKEIERLLAVFDGNNNMIYLQNNLISDRFRQSLRNYSQWTTDQKAKLQELKSEYEAYEVEGQ